MFESTSRYYQLETKTFLLPDGRAVTYKGRRFLPALSKQQTSTQLMVTEGDRIDLIAARILGDPLQYWQIADANLEIYPKRLADKSGIIINIPVTTFEG